MEFHRLPFLGARIPSLVGRRGISRAGRRRVTRRWRAVLASPAGTFEFHQVSEDLFGGYEPYGTAGRFLLATPEKAVFELLYLSAQRGKRFARLPEMELPPRFRRSEIRRWVKKLSSPAHRTAVLTRAAALGL